MNSIDSRGRKIATIAMFFLFALAPLIGIGDEELMGNLRSETQSGDSEFLGTDQNGVRISRLINPNSGSWDEFGKIIVQSDNLLAASGRGEANEDGDGQFTGYSPYTSIYSMQASSASLLHTIHHEFEGFGTEEGGYYPPPKPMAISSDYLAVVGRDYNENGCGWTSKEIVVYSLMDQDFGERVWSADSPDDGSSHQCQSAEYDGFGNSIAIHGDLIFVGANCYLPGGWDSNGISDCREPGSGSPFSGASSGCYDQCGAVHVYRIGCIDAGEAGGCATQENGPVRTGTYLGRILQYNQFGIGLDTQSTFTDWLGENATQGGRLAVTNYGGTIFLFDIINIESFLEPNPNDEYSKIVQDHSWFNYGKVFLEGGYLYSPNYNVHNGLEIGRVYNQVPSGASDNRAGDYEKFSSWQLYGTSPTDGSDPANGECRHHQWAESSMYKNHVAVIVRCGYVTSPGEEYDAIQIYNIGSDSTDSDGDGMPNIIDDDDDNDGIRDNDDYHQGDNQPAPLNATLVDTIPNPSNSAAYASDAYFGYSTSFHEGRLVVYRNCCSGWESNDLDDTDGRGELYIFYKSTWASDEDGDGWSDDVESECGNDPLDDSSTPVDSDSDYICDFLDDDDDGDGWSDLDEASCGTDPTEASSEPTDFDGDSICDLVDDDDDGDGYLDVGDACEGHDDDMDADGDYIPDGCDPDDDGDGVPDEQDACEGHDDGIDDDDDGIPDGCDPLLDSDLDGVSDEDDQCASHDDGIDDDGDGVPDGCDELVDSDGDGVQDSLDQCPGHDDGIDLDSDGVPYGCDPIQDSDMDGTIDAFDSCDGHDDSFDYDEDGTPDGCDTWTMSEETQQNAEIHIAVSFGILVFLLASLSRELQ